MQFPLPDQHGLSEHVLEDMRPVTRTGNGAPLIAYFQFEAVPASVRRAGEVD